MPKSPTLEIYVNRIQERAYLEGIPAPTRNPTLVLFVCVVVFLFAFDQGGIIFSDMADQLIEHVAENEGLIADMGFYAFCVGGVLFGIGSIYLLNALQRIFDQRVNH
jgi:hypothetical protein